MKTSRRDHFMAYIYHHAPNLTAAEELSLAVRITRGDAEARDILVRANLRLVTRWAKRYLDRGIPYEDLISEGTLGLIKAAETFDPYKGYRFDTFARYWIRHSIRAAIDYQARTIKIPQRASKTVSRWLRKKEELSHQLRRQPTDEETNAAIGLTQKQLKRWAADALHASRMVISIERREDDKENGELVARGTTDPHGDAISVMIEAETRDFDLEGLLGCLDERERLLVTLRFGLGDGKPMNRRAVGDQLGLTRERIRQLEKQAIAKMADRAIRNREKTGPPSVPA